MLLARTTISCVLAAIFLATLSAQDATPIPQAPTPEGQSPTPAPDAHGATPIGSPNLPLAFPLEVKWTAALGAPPAFPPAFAGEYAFVALSTNQLVALSMADGFSVWSVECPTTAAAAAGSGLVFIGGDGLVEARAQTDGSTQWRRAIDGRVTELHWDTGWLMASTETGPLLAIRAVDGEVLWQRDLGAPLQAPPSLSGDRAYLPLKDGRVVALSLLTGEDIWTRKLAEPAVGILPVGNRVYVGSKDNQMHSLDAEDGDSDWRWRTGADVLGRPVLDEERIYFVALDHVLRGHDRGSGSMEWKQLLPVRPFTGPLLRNGILIVSGIASELRAYRAADGSPAGEHTVKGAENEEMLLAAPPHVTDTDLVILITKGGQVRGLGSQPPPPDPAAPAAPPGGAPAPADPATAPQGAPPPNTPGAPDAAGGAAPSTP